MTDKSKGDLSTFTKTHGVAKGHYDGVSKQIAIRFNDEQFEEIQALATLHKKSFAHVVRRLCASGIKQVRK